MPSNYIQTYRNEKTRFNFDNVDLMELRKKRLFQVKMSQIIREITIYSCFLFFLYVVAFSNLSSSSFYYNQVFKNTFVEKQDYEAKGLKDVRDLTLCFFYLKNNF